MVGLSKVTDKEKRKLRRQFQQNHIAKDLHQPKYRQRVIDRKRTDNEDGSYFFADRYHEDEVDW